MKYQLSQLIIFIALLSGCKVGPNYRAPEIEVPQVFNEERVEYTFIPSDEDLAHWWGRVFQDPFLDQLLEETIGGNFDYRIALEQVYQARRQYWITFTQILPELDFDAQGSRYRTSQAFRNSSFNNNNNNVQTVTPTAGSSTAKSTAATLSPIQNFFQLGFDAIWEIDLFGKLRRSADAAYDTFEAMAENARAVKIAVLAEVANIYMVICNYQQKVAIASQIVESDRNLLILSIEKHRSGLANDQEIQSLKSLLESDTANLRLFDTILRQNIYSLASLVGRLPESIAEDFVISRPIPQADNKVPISIPGDLLRRRPDISSIERQLAAATEQIGVAVANLYPSISLIGSSSSFAANPLQGANIGWSSDQFKELLTSKSLVWGIGGLITWPVFDFGQRQAAVDVQWSIAQQTYYNYQKTVITAMQEVEQSLVTYFFDKERVNHFSKEAAANKRSFDLTTDLYEAGLASFSDVLTAQNTWLNSFNLLLDSKQALASDLIAIYKAMGGDW